MQEQIHPRKLRGKGREAGGENVACEKGGTAQGETARQTVLQTVHVGAEGIGDAADLLHRADIGLPGLRQRDGQGAAVKNRRADAPLRLFDHQAQGRLGEEHLLRRLGKTFVGIDRVNIVHLTKKLHLA